MSSRLYDQAAPDQPDPGDTPPVLEPTGQEDVDPAGEPLDAESSAESPPDEV